MSNPTFFVGLVFSSIEKLREAIAEYSLRNRVEIKLPRNDKRQLLKDAPGIYMHHWTTWLNHFL